MGIETRVCLAHSFVESWRWQFSERTIEVWEHTQTHTHTHTQAWNTHGRKQGTKTPPVLYLQKYKVIIFLEYFFCTLPKPECQYLEQTLLLLLNKPDFKGARLNQKSPVHFLGVGTMVPTLVPWLRTSVLRVPWVCSVKSGVFRSGSSSDLEWVQLQPFCWNWHKNHWDCEN
jgi:hypothetical protein